MQVATVRASSGILRPALTIPGTIAPYQTVALSNAISEPAQAVYVEEGEHVRRGEVLAQLDVDDLQATADAAQATANADAQRAAQARYSAQVTVAQAPLQVRGAEATLEQATRTYLEALQNLRRDGQLVANGYLPQQNYDEQEVVVQNDRQAIAVARASVAESQATQSVNGSTTSGLQGATVAAAQGDEAAQSSNALSLRRQIARATIVSPIDGVVINRNLNPGEYPSGRQIFTLEANATVFAILTASAVQAYQVRAGDRVKLARAGLPNGRFAGRVVAVLDAATPGSTNFTIKVAVPNDNDALRAGTPVEATVALAPVRGVIVPATAFVDDTHTRVVTVRDGKAQQEHVIEISTDGANSVVSGVASGTLLVRDGGTSVRSGDPVQTTH